MFYRYPINDVHIHLFDPKDIDECIAMVDECGYTNWTFLACTVIDSPFALAQNLLCNTDLDILTISQECGFENQRTFNRVFQRQCHTTPSQYRMDFVQKKKLSI